MFHAQYPDDIDDLNMDHWHAFEEKNPHIFRGMYRFWCQKPHTS
jgi:hypothetical protein